MCEGFHVESSDRRVGVVNAVRYMPGARSDAPSWLVVRVGASDMLLIVPVAEVASVFLAERRIVLRSPAATEAGERVSAAERSPSAEDAEMSARLVAAALARVASGWCQGAVAEDEERRAVRPWSPEARRWSMLGALLASWDGGPVEDLGDAVGALHTATDESSLEAWNNSPERTKQEVVAAFERVIELLERGEAGTALPGEERFRHWLAACAGFQVHADRGRLGMVEEVRLSGGSEPEALAVRAGFLGRRLLVVPVDEVERIVPRRKRVVLRPATA
ncbi:MAG TPA: hypothetical protein VG079_05880 [Gaiellaceae bacterium]|nr:hypothetical protein [Gaiellaceae bacterium]